MRGRSFDSDHVAAAKARPVPVRSARQGGALSQPDDGRLHPAGEALLALQRHYGNQYVQRAVIQAKLVVGPPRDRYEREADRVAQAVVRGTTGPRTLGVQSVGGSSSNAPVRAHGPGAAGSLVAAGLQQDIQQARGHGQSLPEHVRAPMEQALGADLTHVRLHTDSEADRLSRSLQARAFTSGRDIFLRRGQADLTSPAGRELIAHELTHVAQQAGSGGAGEGVIQRQLYQITSSPSGVGDQVYDDALNITATRDQANQHIFVGDTDGNSYEIGTDASGNPALVPAGFHMSNAPVGWTLAGTQGFTSPPTWARRPVDQYWESPGRSTIYSHSPRGSAYKQGATGQGKYGGKSRRAAAGYMNPKQFAVAMLPLWENALLPAGSKAKGKTHAEKVKWLKKPKRLYQVRSGLHGQTKTITGYRQSGSTKSAVVLGHSTSASTLFNQGGHGQPAGHTVPRATNYAFNQTDAPYHGLEDYIWSAQSSQYDPAYESPRPDRNSHRTYWDPNEPGHTGGPWHSYDAVSDQDMIKYIENKLAKVPAANRDNDHLAARIELAKLKSKFTQAHADELLSMIKTKGW